MKKKTGLKKIIISVFALQVFLSFSCSTQTEYQKKYGADINYFAGLKDLANGKTNEAKIKFKRCIKKGSYYCAQRSAQVLAGLGTLQEQCTASLELVQNFNDSDSLLVAVRQLSKAEEYSKVIEISQGIDLSKENNETIKLRLEALKIKKSSLLLSESYKWFTTRPISNTHYQVYKDILDSYYNEDAIDKNIDIIRFRLNVFNRKFTAATNQLDRILMYFEQKDVRQLGFLASDLGKTFLYSDTIDPAKSASLFKDLAVECANTPSEFYFWFYSGRLFSKQYAYGRQAENSFTSAILTAVNTEQKDNAIWYLLDSSLKVSIDSVISNLAKYCSQWTDPSYFDDFFESLVSAIMIAGKWNLLPKLLNQLVDYASDETVAQFAYLYARFTELGITEGSTEDIKSAYTRACFAGGNVYYKLLAAKNLELSNSEFEEIIENTNRRKNNKIKELPNDFDPEKAESANILLRAYVDFGFPEKIYAAYQTLRPLVTTDTAFYIANYLEKFGNSNNEYFVQGLRIASRAALNSQEPITKQQLKLVYPKNFKEFVERCSLKYSIPENILYSLIRSESFFDAKIESSAGAIGLTQLMENTASDVARKLHISNYSLLDPENNIEFGSYYLYELYSRLNDKYLMAFFAYNGGISRVRRWLNTSLINFGKRQNMPEDLFLETVPYYETREYGRKLISTSLMYTYLYSENEDSKNKFEEMLDELLF